MILKSFGGSESWSPWDIQTCLRDKLVSLLTRGKKSGCTCISSPRLLNKASTEPFPPTLFIFIFAEPYSRWSHLVTWPPRFHAISWKVSSIFASTTWTAMNSPVIHSKSQELELQLQIQQDLREAHLCRRRKRETLRGWFLFESM